MAADINAISLPCAWASRILWLGHVPSAVQEAVTIDVARRGVLLEGVERLALVRPHLLAVVASQDGHVARRLGVVAGEQGWPIVGAGAVAHRLAACVLVERIEGHALGIDEDFTL